MILILLLLVFSSCSSLKQPKQGPFIGYELVEMTLNEFDHFAGEIGYNFDSVNQLRIIRMDVSLQERHLESDEATAITGTGVHGKFKGWELSYDRYLFGGNFFWSLNTGKFDFNYYHNELDESSENNSATFGTGFGFTDSNFLKVEGLYLSFSYPVRILVNKIEEKKLGGAKVNSLNYLDNIWFFLGYKF